MKAKNSKEITRGYILFAAAMSLSILVGTGCIYFLVRTAGKEVAYIELRSAESDTAFTHQIALSEKTDSLFNNLILLNAEERINQIVIQNRISTQKMQMLNILNQLNENDAALYRRMSDRVNTVLQIKDSIRTMTVQEQLLKKELQRCMQDSRSTSRRRFLNNSTN